MPVIKGIHHVSMKCRGEEELKKVLAFYVDLLGLKVSTKMDNGVMIDTGNGQIEVFTNLDYEPDTGIIRHFALLVDDAVAWADKCKAAGYEIFMGPKEIENGGKKKIIAFCFGPLGEQIEFYQLM